jgi:hypothetical protein
LKDKGYGNDKGVVLIYPANKFLVKLDLLSFEIRNLKSLEIFLICGSDNNFLLIAVHSDLIHLSRVGKVSNSKLVFLFGIFSDKNRLEGMNFGGYSLTLAELSEIRSFSFLGASPIS